MYDVKSVNKVTLVGWAGRDPEVVEHNGKLLVNLTLCTMKRLAKRNGGTAEKEWHTLNMWGTPAVFCKDYVRKGDQLYVEGSIRSRQVEKDGQTRYNYNIVVGKVVQLSNGDGRLQLDQENESLGDTAPAQEREEANGNV